MCLISYLHFSEMSLKLFPNFRLVLFNLWRYFQVLLAWPTWYSRMISRPCYCLQYYYVNELYNSNASKIYALDWTIRHLFFHREVPLTWKAFIHIHIHMVIPSFENFGLISFDTPLPTKISGKSWHYLSHDLPRIARILPTY